MSSIIPTTSAYRLTSKEPHIISLMLLSAFAAMGAILMTPALPKIATFFSVSTGRAQLGCNTYVCAFCIPYRHVIYFISPDGVTLHRSSYLGGHSDDISVEPNP